MASPIEAVTVYQKVDEDGTVIFTDEPDDASIPVELSPTKIEKNVERWRIPGGLGTPAREEHANEFIYESFSINTPTSNEAIRSNNGNISVSVSVKPFLAPGHRVMYYMDGNLVASNSSASTTLQGVSNGEHTLIAAIINPEGLELTRTQPVTFNVLRATVGGRGNGEITPQKPTETFNPEAPKEFDQKAPSGFQQKPPPGFQKKSPDQFQQAPPKKWTLPLAPPLEAEP